MAATVPLVQHFTLPGEISRKFAVDWSVDNKIALCTSKAIYILSSNCSPVETGFPSPLHKQVICAAEEPMQLNPIAIPSNPYKFMESEKDRDNLYNVLMDHTLNPMPSERAESFKSFRSCKWSPKGAASASRCLLATLTMDHRLCLYEESEREWRCLCDLSELLKEQNLREQAENKQNKSKKRRREPKKKGRKQASDDDEDYEDSEEEENNADISKMFNFKQLAEETYRIAPVEITWTGMFGSPPTSVSDQSHEFCFLIVAMKSGHIQFWKVSPSDRRIVSLVHEYDTRLGMLTSISWQQTSSIAGFLLCGSLKGVLAFIPIGIVMAADQEPRVMVKNMCKLWDEEDNVAVDHIAVLKIALRKYVIVCAKSHALVGCEIVLTDESIIIRNVGHSFGLHSLPVTGMAVLDTRSIPQYRVLISTMEGIVVEIKVSLGEEVIKFQHEKIPIDLDLSNNMIQGLAVSSNGLLCGLVLNTAVYYDHLEKKEPLQFAMFVTKSFDDIYAKLKSVLKPQFSFLPTSSNTISNHSDYLECLRITLASGAELPQWIMAFLESDVNEKSSPIELYFMRYFLHAYVSGLAINAPKDIGDLEERLRSVECLIMRNYISKVFQKCQENQYLLTPGQSQSLLLMADWIYKEFGVCVEEMYSALGYDLPGDPSGVPARETCDICKSAVKLEDVKVGRCERNHIFARCCQSLLLCDIVPYLQCPSCKSVALRDVWNFGITCTYCGMTMV